MSDVSLTFTRDSRSQSVFISIVDDTTVEELECFVARLSVNTSVYSGVRLAPNTADVCIDPNG